MMVWHRSGYTIVDILVTRFIKKLKFLLNSLSSQIDCIKNPLTLYHMVIAVI